jgi:hypothetical protein
MSIIVYIYNNVNIIILFRSISPETAKEPEIRHPELDSGSTVWLAIGLDKTWIPCQARNDEVLSQSSKVRPCRTTQ